MSENFYQHNNARHVQSQIPTKEKSSSELSRGRSPLLSQRRSLSDPSVSEDDLHQHSYTRTRSHVNPLYRVAYCYVNVI